MERFKQLTRGRKIEWHLSILTVLIKRLINQLLNRRWKSYVYGILPHPTEPRSLLRSDNNGWFLPYGHVHQGVWSSDFAKIKKAIQRELGFSVNLGINLMGDKIENIFNFLQLSDSIATAGQPTKTQLSLVKDSGYKTVINLATSASENSLPDEKKIVESLGMKYIHIPVDFNNPTSEDFAAFCQAMEENNQQPLLVHCAANLRVAAFMYIYRLTQENFDNEQAKVDLAKVWTPNETWEQFIDSQLHR